MAKHNESGSEAEIKVAKYLRENGYEIIDNNWKTNWCEVDIIAKKNKIISFVEVKYRQNQNQGGGFDYITRSKAKQMQRAAESWVQINSWEGEYILSAAEVSGGDFEIEFIEQI